MHILDGHTRTCGLIGNPVAHTLSPMIQNYMAQATGTNLVYLPFPVAQGNLEAAVRGALALDFLGLNVTIPYKSDVIKCLAQIDPLAERIGAVNTLVRCEGGYKGYNTDMPGLYRAMQQEGVDIAGRKVVILGAGGVARAVAVMLLDKGAAGVYILNRTVDRAQAVADEINRMAGRAFARAYAISEYERIEGERWLVIQATSVGMHPYVEDVVIEDREFYRRVETGYDLIFNPAVTRFMELTREAGGRACNGARMLVYQGIIAFELWTGVSISQNIADELCRKMALAMEQTAGGQG
ncbi:MAG: shikimate dehydrogenase [bacterium]|nr:shikimate dehydrogenase [bacterium]MCM1376376.1 shikimate dehydrogenase [Muribaculum sp.]